MKLILDIASGKFNSELIYDGEDSNSKDNNDVVVHVDRCFSGEFGCTIDQIADKLFPYTIADMQITTPIHHYFCKSDIFEFLDNFPLKCFDFINCNRFFEHLEYCSGEIGRMIEACNVITKNKAGMQFVVPNHEKLASMILQQNHSANDLMVINTEFCNIRCDPHLSIWTPKFAKYYINQESTWEVIDIDPNYSFAGRNIYMKVSCKKVNSVKQTNQDTDVDQSF